jgi:hypothetical protein
MEIPANDTTARVYAPDDTDILYTGRIDFSDPAKPQYSAPGVSMQARFRVSIRRSHQRFQLSR